MAKKFWMKWEPKLWMSDPDLSRCPPATRGIWMDLLSAMFLRNGEGSISGTVEELSRICRCSVDEMREALRYISVTETGTTCERNGIVTVENRKMKRECHEQQLSNRRVLNYRKRKCNGNETPLETPAKRDCNAVESKSKSESSVVPLSKNGECNAPKPPLEEDPEHENSDPGGDGDDGYGPMSPDLLRIVRAAGAEFNLSPAKIPELNEWVSLVGYELAKQCLDEAMASKGMSGFRALTYVQAMSISRRAEQDIRQRRPAHQQSGRALRRDR